jgi:hypothetical protein
MDMVTGLAFLDVVVRELEAARTLFVVISRNCTECEGAENRNRE